MDKIFTTITPVVRLDLVEGMLESLHRNTDNIFYSIVIDQTVNGLDMSLRDRFKDLIIIRSPLTDVHYTGSLGFSLATNLGVKLVETPYFMMVNDDVRYIHPGWWDGVMESFDKIEKATPESPAMIVNLASVRLADWSLGRASGDHFDILPYKEHYTNEDWDFLINESHYINEHLTIKPGSVFDGVTLYASVIDTAKYREIGGTDDRYYVAAGEDYDLGCKARMYGYRSINTTLSWCWHYWSLSFTSLRDQDDIRMLKIPELEWNHNHGKWGERFNIWGIQCRECKKKGVDQPLLLPKGTHLTAVCPKHPEETYDMPTDTFIPL